MTYVKYISSNSIEYIPNNIGVINPKDSHYGNYAKNNGYKELKITSSPSIYHTKSYEEYDEYITTVWTAPSLDTLKISKKEEADRIKEYALSSSSNVTVDNIGEIVYNQQAIINIMGMKIAGVTGTFILADDSVIEVDEEKITAICQAFIDYTTKIYANKTYAYTLIDASDDVDSLITLDVSTIEYIA